MRAPGGGRSEAGRAARCLSVRFSSEGRVADVVFPEAGKVGAQEGRKGTLTSSREPEEADEGGHPRDVPPLPLPARGLLLGRWGGPGAGTRVLGHLKRLSFWVGFMPFPPCFRAS